MVRISGKLTTAMEENRATSTCWTWRTAAPNDCTKLFSWKRKMFEKFCCYFFLYERFLLSTMPCHAMEMYNKCVCVSNVWFFWLPHELSSRWLTLVHLQFWGVGENVYIHICTFQNTWTFKQQHTRTHTHIVCTMIPFVMCLLLSVASTGFLFRFLLLNSLCCCAFLLHLDLLFFFSFLFSPIFSLCSCSLFVFLSVYAAFSCFKLIFNYRSIFCCIGFVFYVFFFSRALVFVVFCFVFCHAHVFFSVRWSALWRGVCVCVLLVSDAF